MLNVALVGVGGISEVHIPAWNRMAETKLVALCDIRPEQMEKYENVNKYTDFDEMLSKEQIDILDICLPTYMHVEFAMKAMNLGINVLCEKPISLNKDDVAKVYKCAKDNNVKFMVAQVLRFWPEYVKLKEIYDTQKYGKLLSGCFYRLSECPGWSWDGWMRDEKRSGFVPFDLHIHDLDFMVYAFGKPKKANTFRTKRTDQDYISAVYEYDNFFINMESSWYASPHPFTTGFRLQFEKSVVVNKDGKLVIYEKDVGTVDVSNDGNKESGAINLPQTDAYYEEIKYFVDCVLKNKKPEIIKPEELETVLDILDLF